MELLSTPELLARIGVLLAQATGLPIDAERMHADALYARDVLLVCEALQDSEGPALARRFRAVQNLRATAGDNPAATRRVPLNAATRADRRANGRRERRRQRGRAPQGRERRRGPRRRADNERVPLPVTAEAGPKTAPAGPRIFSSIFGHTTQPPGEEVAPERSEPAAPRRWFARKSGPR